MTSPRHPGVETALARDDVAPGIAFVTYLPGDRVIERGIFTSGPGYDEGDNRWHALAQVERGAHQIIERTICLYDAGITPAHDGESWADAITIPDTE